MNTVKLKDLSDKEFLAIPKGTILTQTRNSFASINEGDLKVVRTYINSHGSRFVVFSDGDGWFDWRFKGPASLKTKNRAPRDAKGRFISTKVAAKPVLVAPQVLKKGAIYSVKRKRGFTVANLRSFSFGELAVFSAHGKPFLAKRKQVFLATPNQVSEYLAENK